MDVRSSRYVHTYIGTYLGIIRDYQERMDAIAVERLHLGRFRHIINAFAVMYAGNMPDENKGEEAA